MTLLPAPPPAWTQGPTADLWHRLTDTAGLAWLLAYVALLLGHARIARWVAVLAFVPTAVSLLSHVFAPGSAPNWFTWYLLVLDGCTVLALTAFGRDTPAVRPRPWLLALPVATGLVLGLVFLPAPAPDSPPLLDWAGLCSVAYLVGAGWYAWRGSPRTGWAPALALLALAVVGLRISSIFDYATGMPFTDRSALIGIGLVEAAAVAAAGVPLVLRTSERSVPNDAASALSDW